MGTSNSADKKENRIIEVLLTRNAGDGKWVVSISKEFTEENGGGTQEFFEDGGTDIHRALDVAKGMVTVSPGQRTDLYWFNPTIRPGGEEAGIGNSDVSGEKKGKREKGD